MPDKFRDMLRSACARPELYVGRASLGDLANYLTGYCHGSQDAGQPIIFDGRFLRWVETQFCISSPAWHWVRILQHVYGDDRSAIDALPQLYNQFCDETQNLTDEEIWKRLESQMLKKHGSKDWHPDDSETWTSPVNTQ